MRRLIAASAVTVAALAGGGIAVAQDNDPALTGRDARAAIRAHVVANASTIAGEAVTVARVRIRACERVDTDTVDCFFAARLNRAGADDSYQGDNSSRSRVWCWGVATADGAASADAAYQPDPTATVTVTVPWSRCV